MSRRDVFDGIDDTGQVKLREPAQVVTTRIFPGRHAMLPVAVTAPSAIRTVDDHTEEQGALRPEDGASHAMRAAPKGCMGRWASPGPGSPTAPEA